MSVSGLNLAQVNQKRLNYVKTRADVSDGTEKLSFSSNFLSFFRESWRLSRFNFLDKKHGNCSVCRGCLKYSAPV